MQEVKTVDLPPLPFGRVAAHLDWIGHQSEKPIGDARDALATRPSPLHPHEMSMTTLSRKRVDADPLDRRSCRAREARKSFGDKWNGQRESYHRIDTFSSDCACIP